MTIETRETVCRGKKFKFSCDTEWHASYFCHEDERDVRERWWDIKPGDVVLDAGAAHGAYTLSALSQGASKVVCWSPEHDSEFLKASIKLNGWEDKAIVLVEGLWSTIGFVRTENHEKMPSFFLTKPSEWEEEMPPNAFPVSTIDRKVNQLGLDKIDWLKMDVEGAEIEVIRGAMTTLREFKPRILIENHLFKDGGIKDKVAKLIFGLGVGYHEVGTVPYHSVSHSVYAIA